MKVGTRVVINGTLYQGGGAVTDYWDASGNPADDNQGRIGVREGQPFPQVGVITDSRRRLHYNAADISAGKVAVADGAVADAPDSVADNGRIDVTAVDAPVAENLGGAEVVGEPFAGGVLVPGYADADSRYIGINLPAGVTKATLTLEF